MQILQIEVSSLESGVGGRCVVIENKLKPRTFIHVSCDGYLFRLENIVWFVIQLRIMLHRFLRISDQRKLKPCLIEPVAIVMRQADQGSQGSTL